MITYNHEKYIRKAIEGVLMQNTNFPVELIIANDASNDRTDIVIRQYIKNHPKEDIVKYFSHESNLGMMSNFIFAFEQCKGHYVAMCEGDDYWTDPYKLQKQVDFLEANTDYTLCFHQVEILEDRLFRISDLNESDNEETFCISDLAKRNFIHTPSVVFKNGLINFPSWFLKSPVGDYPIHMFNAAHGKIRYFPQLMAVYRVHTGGVWSLKNPVEQIVQFKWVIDKLDKYFNFKYHKEFYNQPFINKLYDCQLNYYKKERNFLKYFGVLIQYFKNKKSANQPFGYFILRARQYFYKK